MARTRNVRAAGWILVAVGLLGLTLLAAADHAPESAPPGPGVWAHEADTWVEGRNQAAQLGIAYVLRYIAPDIVFEGGVGREAYATYLQYQFGRAMDERYIGDAYLDVRGAVVVWDSWGVDAIEVGPGGVTTEEQNMDPAWGYNQDAPLAVAANRLSDAYAGAWSSAVPERVGWLYASTARVEDSVLGLDLRGRAVIEDHVRQLQTMDGLVVARPVEYVVEDVYMQWTEPPEVLLLLDGDDGRGCPGRVAVYLTLAERVIAQERRYHEIGSARRCWSTGRLASGWWTGLEPVPPYDDELTGAVDAGGQRIDVRNGDPTLERLLQWAMERFDAAELPSPAVESVTFEEGGVALQCAGTHNGVAIDLGDTAQLFVCLGRSDVCAYAGCEAFDRQARLVVLHELAHAWMYRHVDEATQRAFLDRMGLESWSDRGLDWYLRGVEQAAQIVAWGLMDEAVVPTRLGDRPCAELADAFRVLTGIAPLQSRCTPSG